MNAHYTVCKMSKDWKIIGLVHSSDDDHVTDCGKTIDEHWVILTNLHDGEITCKKCIEIDAAR